MNPGPFVPRTIRSQEKSFETSFFSGSWSSGAHQIFINYGTVISTSTGCSTSGATSVCGRDSTSGITAELRSPRTCDLRTMVEVVSARLMAPERVTTVQGSERAFGPPDEIRLAS